MENPLKNLFKKSESSVLGVDIGPSSIKIVQFRKKKGKAVLETYGALALGPYAGVEVGRATQLPPEKVAEALLDLMREANITSRECGFSIPMSSSLVSTIEIPKVDERDLHQIIPIEARKYVPVPISEVMLDWWVIPKIESSEDEAGQNMPAAFTATNPTKAEKIEVLLVVIHNDAVAKAREVIKLGGLQSSFFEIEIFSTIRSVLEREVSPVMIFDMGASTTKLYIVERGILRMSHVVNRGSQDLTLALSKSLGISSQEAEVLKRTKGISENVGNAEALDVISSTLTYIFSEANRVLLNYQKKYLRNVSKVILTGGGAGLKGLLEVARASLQNEVFLADPFSKIEAPAFLERVLREVGPEFAVAVGVGLRKLQEKE